MDNESYFLQNRVNIQQIDKNNKNIDNYNQEQMIYTNRNIQTTQSSKLFIPQHEQHLTFDRCIQPGVQQKNPFNAFENHPSFNKFPVNSRLHSNLEMDIQFKQQNIIHNSDNVNHFMDNTAISTRKEKNRFDLNNHQTQTRYTGGDVFGRLL
jgi:hypothetical protein